MYTAPPSDMPIAYDLRQAYAKIVGEHLIDIATFRKNQEYSKYFEALEDLYIVVAHKFKKSKAKKKEQTYKELKKELVDTVTKYREAYLGKSNDPEQVGKVKDILRKIEMFMYHKMDQANMFGSKRNMEGLI